MEEGDTGRINAQGRLTTSTTAITIAENTVLHIRAGARVRTTGRQAYGISIAGDGVVINNSGRVETTGDIAHGIFSGSDILGVEINHLAGVIETDATDSAARSAYGIYVRGGGDGVVKVRSSIIARGPSSYAIWLELSNQLDLELGNGEEIEGGIRVVSAGVDEQGNARKHLIVLGQGASLTTSYNQIHGISSSGLGTSVRVEGTITTKRMGAHGIYLQSGGNGVVKVRNNVSSSGAHSYAIKLADGNQLDLELGNGEAITGGIKVGSAGVEPSGTPRRHLIVLEAGASLTTITYNNMNGIEVAGAGSIIDIQGSIIVTGSSAQGIVSTGANSRITISGSVSATGSTAQGGNVALYLRNGQILILAASAQLTGRIDKDETSIVIDQKKKTIQAGESLTIDKGMRIVVSEDGVVAVTLTGAGASLTNSGVIEARGAGLSYAIYAGSSSSGVRLNHNEGVVRTQGAAAHAIYLQGGGNGVVQVRAPIFATGAGAFAIHLAGANQLDLELGNHEAIRGGIKIGSAGIDDKGTQATSDDEARTHLIVLREGAWLVTTDNNIHGIETTGAGSVINILGTVQVTGTGAQGIRTTGASSSVTVSGAVLAADDTETAIYARNATVTLNADAIILGQLDTDNTVTLVDNRSASSCTNKITGQVVIPQTFTTNNGCLTVEKRATITLPITNSSPAFFIQAVNATFTNRGAISTSRNAAGYGGSDAAPYGAHISAGRGVKLVNAPTGTISTQGTLVHGIAVQSNDVEIVNYGRITTQRNFAHGIYSFSSSDGVTIKHMAGMITTNTSNANGIYVAGDGNGVVKVRGSINAHNGRSFSINLAANNQLDLELQAGKTIQGGVRLRGAGVDDNGTPNDNTDDTARTHRIVIGKGASLTTSSGSIYGIDLAGKASGDIHILGTVQAINGGATPIYVAGASFTITISGLVSAGNANAVAIYLRGEQVLILEEGAQLTGRIDKDATSIVIDRRLTGAYDFTTQGATSTSQAAKTALNTYIRAYHRLTSSPRATSFAGGLSPNTLNTQNLADPIATIDTNAKSAWAEGWTGKGVKVAIMDDFGGDPSKLSHGCLVSFVVLSVAPEVDWIGYSTGFDGHCPLLEIKPTLKKVTDPTKYHGEYHHEISQNGFYIVNQSFNTPRLAYGKQEWEAYKVSVAGYDMSIQPSSQQASQPNGLHKNMLFVKSAGNGAEACEKAGFGRAIAGCSLLASALLKLRETKPKAGDRVLFVGSLADDDGDPNTADTMASYSLQAGNDFKYDFMVAYDDVIRAGDNGGTSLAAPRVTGAAALVRHKFPNLDGAGLKQVLLQTADDLGATGPDPIFGMGKLNLQNALSPQGKVTSQ